MVAKTALKPYWQDDLLKAIIPPQISCMSDFADNEIILPQETNREGGRWQTVRTPYNRGPMEAFLFPFVRQSTMCASTQLGKTMAHLLIPMLYSIAIDPYPTAMIYPSADEDRLMSETRVQPLIIACPATAAQMPVNPDKFKLRRMIFPGMSLYMLSAGTLGDAKQKQLRNIFFDEIEAYNPLEGQAQAEGDIVSLYEERAKGYWDIRKIFISSSRVRVGGVLDNRLAMSQVVFKWHIKCPHCQAWETLAYENFFYEDLGEGALNRIEAARDSAYFLCCSCGGHITDEHKGYINLDSSGDWLPGYIQVDSPNIITEEGDEEESEKYLWRPMPGINLEDYYKEGSYVWSEYLARHKPSLIGWTDLYTSYSPWVSFADIAEKAVISSGKFDDEKVFLKDWWCKVARQKMQVVRSSELLELCDQRKEGEVPLEAVALVCGIDNQANRCYVVVWAVNRFESHKEEMWLVYAREIPKTGQNSPTGADYSAVADFLKMRFKRVGTDQASIPIWRAALDTGGTKNVGSDDSMTEECYQFISEHGGKVPGRVWGVKGSHFSRVQKGLPPIGTGKAKVNNLYPVIFVDTSYYGHTIARLIEKKKLHLHKGTTQEFVNHLSGEIFVQDDKGKWKWQLKSTSRRIDYRAATKYALAMLEEIDYQSIKNCALGPSSFSYARAQAQAPAKNVGSARMHAMSSRMHEMQSRLKGRIR